MWFNTFTVCDTLKVAVTDSFAFIVTLQAPLPAHAPDQPTKYPPFAGVAFNVTIVPEENDALHVEGQLMPAGLLFTMPVEVPFNVTVS
jgi:hypothetical protein